MPDLDEQYHSKHGAIQEAMHVFIEMGLRFTLSRKRYNHNPPLKILEYGLGTGLNAMLTAIRSDDQKIDYTGLEAYPVTDEEAAAMDYGSQLDRAELYLQLHAQPWNETADLTEDFTFTKIQSKFEDYDRPGSADLIYYDAFGPRTQPELWSQSLFESCYKNLNKNGVLVTYCAQGQARRNMQAAGFNVERLPGPPGKREMLRAVK